MASIYELTDQYRALEAAAYEDDLEYDEFSARLAQIEDAIEDKTDGYCAVIAGLKADAAAIKEQEQRLSKRRRGLEAKAEQLRQALADAMTAQGRDKIKTKLFTASFRASIRLEITDLTAVPEEYFKPRTEADVRKSEIKKELTETGEVLPWARLVSERGLTIR